MTTTLGYGTAFRAQDRYETKQAMQPAQRGAMSPVEARIMAPVETGIVAPVETGIVAPVETGNVAPCETGITVSVETRSGAGCPDSVQPQTTHRCVNRRLRHRARTTATAPKRSTAFRAQDR